MSEGIKYDNEKPPMALLEPEFLEEIARVLGFGANKYAADNWRDGISYRRYISAAYRHLGAFSKGEDLDPESQLTHLGHLGCCIMFLYWISRHNTKMDDRWKGKE